MRRLYSSHKVDEIKVKENEDVINAGGTGDYSNVCFFFLLPYVLKTVI